MASNPVVPVNVEMNDALQKAIAEATHPDVIKARVHEALEQQVAAKAEADAAAAKATEDAAAAKAAVDAAAAAEQPTHVAGPGGKRLRVQDCPLA